MKNRTAVTAAICGGVVGIAIGLAVKVYFLDPYLASLLDARQSTQDSQVLADNLRRDQMVAEHLAKLDASTKKAACEGYIGGLKEQNLTISPIINQACSGS